MSGSSMMARALRLPSGRQAIVVIRAPT